MTGQYVGWTNLKTGARVSHSEMVQGLITSDCVLLGEQHNRADHHRWQLHVVAGLAAHRPICVGYEMFPARLDPVLADWVAGGLSEADFLEKAEWQKVWGFPEELYMPLFRFCRDMGVPMVGLNCERDLVRNVGANGWGSIPEEAREGISPACPSSPAYRKFIFDLTGGARPDRQAKSPDDPAFDRFVRAQEVWDRAFATRICQAAKRPEAPLVVGIIGQGHLQYGGGVSWQLADLGFHKAKVLIPSDPANPNPPADAADAVFHLAPSLEAE